MHCFDCVIQGYEWFPSGLENIEHRGVEMGKVCMYFQSGASDYLGAKMPPQWHTLPILLANFYIRPQRPKVAYLTGPQQLPLPVFHLGTQAVGAQSTSSNSAQDS